jgi:hypothetical protein
MAADFVTISILEISETNLAPAKKHKLWKKFEFLKPGLNGTQGKEADPEYWC